MLYIYYYCFLVKGVLFFEMKIHRFIFGVHFIGSKLLAELMYWPDSFGLRWLDALLADRFDHRGGQGIEQITF